MLDIKDKLKDLNLNGCKVELIGNWFWVSGKTFNIKEDLKNLGFFYSNNKKAWFFNGDDKKINRGYYTIDELRNRFVSKEVNYLGLGSDKE